MMDTDVPSLTVNENHEDKTIEDGVSGSNDFNTSWNGWYWHLVTFRHKYGHCNAVQCLHGVLGNWVFIQRKLYRLQKLKPKWIQKLNAIGFDWSFWDDDFSAFCWDERYKELIEYKKINGHCNVTYNNHTKLCAWVARQRVLIGVGRLNPDREQKLADIGVEWDL
jgi:Helicase associated domain